MYPEKEGAEHLAPVPAPTNANEPIVGTVPLAGQAEQQPALQTAPGAAQAHGGTYPAATTAGGQQQPVARAEEGHCGVPYARPPAWTGWQVHDDDRTPGELHPLTVPPGFAGQIAQDLFEASPHPLPEAAIAGALGLLAGINGRAYTVSRPGTGLNLYVVLVAASGMGKDAAVSRIHYLLKAACEAHIALAHGRRFVVPSNAVSEAALSRQLLENPCFVNVVNELGRRLLEMSQAKTASPLYGVRTMLTQLWDKSGPHSVVGGRVYSKKDDNIADIQAPAYSVLGDGTPGTVFSALSTSAAEDGFLSRLNIIECTTTTRPVRNANVLTTPSDELLQALRYMVYAAIQQQERRVELTWATDAQQLFANFEEECTDRLNRAGNDESRRALWVRAALKVCRVAGNLAVADHHAYLAEGRPMQLAPEIQRVHVQWAMDLERRNIAALQGRMDRGDAGEDDDALTKKVLSLIKKYIKTGAPSGYKINPRLQPDGIIPHLYLTKATANVSAFKNHKFGANRALSETLRGLLDSGYLMEADKKTLADDYGFNGRCFYLMQVLD